MLSGKLQKKVEIYKDADDYVLFYNHKSSINSKVINGYQEVGEVEKSMIATNHTGDVQLDAGGGMIRHWYDGYFITYGYQTLKNTIKGSVAGNAGCFI